MLEAIAAGTPVVATRVGGVPDVVDDSQALLVPPGDPQALADAIQDVREDPLAAQERAAAARRRLDRDFSLDRWLDQYDQLYDDVAAVSEGEPSP